MTTFTDDFNRADSTDLGAGWVEVSGDWSIVSNQLSPGVDTGTVVLRAATAMASNDNFAQVTIAVTAVASQGVWCRGNATITSGYLWRNDGSSWDLFAVVGGSFTVVGTYAAAATPGDVAKVQAVGSTIKGFVNGIERVSVTDTGVATGASVGIRSGTAAGIRYDDFSAADVTAGTTLGTAAATEAAQQLTGAKAATLGLAAGVETAQPLAGAKAGTLGLGVASEAAQALAGGKTAALPAASETGAAQPMTGSKAATLVPAVEVGAARPLAAAGLDVDIDIAIGTPVGALYAVGAPRSGDWEVGAPC